MAIQDPDASVEPDDTVVSIENVTKRFNRLTAVDDVSIPISDGEFLTILGPSGAGKTTLLHMIAGFQRPTEGKIVIAGREVSDEPPNERDIGLVFQSLALFPHMTVEENIAFPLKMRRESVDDIDEKVEDVLELVRLPVDYRDKPVTDLSGGQQQRVAFARAIVYEPTLLLLDEPLSSLDKKLREEMRAELARIHDKTDLTIVHVTHNQTEALAMADRIAVINDGSLEQLAPAHDIYSEPATPFVADFIGNTTMLQGVLSTADGVVTVDDVDIAVSAEGFSAGDVTLGLRAEHITIGDGAASFDNVYDATVEQVSFEGNRVQYRVSVHGIDEMVQITHQNPASDDVFNTGDETRVGWATDAAFVYPR